MKTQRTCLECDYPLQGRRDKKFCCDACRSAYHNQLRGPAENFIRNTNVILRKNRKILFDFYQRNMTKIKRSQLLEAGFSFKYATGYELAQHGVHKKYCYDVSYLEIKESQYQIVLIEPEK